MLLKRISILIILFCAGFSLTLTKAQSYERQWQEVKSVSGNFKAVSSHPEIEVFSSPNILMIKVYKESEVRLFTILGKLLLSQKLPPGIYEYKIDSHGIFIVKTDENSCKVAV